MKEVRYSTKAKKDLKRYRNDLAKMQELFHVLQVLATGGELDRPVPLILIHNFVF